MGRANHRQRQEEQESGDPKHQSHFGIQEVKGKVPHPSVLTPDSHLVCNHPPPALCFSGTGLLSASGAPSPHPRHWFLPLEVAAFHLLAPVLGVLLPEILNLSHHSDLISKLASKRLSLTILYTHLLIILFSLYHSSLSNIFIYLFTPLP